MTDKQLQTPAMIPISELADNALVIRKYCGSDERATINQTKDPMAHRRPKLQNESKNDFFERCPQWLQTT